MALERALEAEYGCRVFLKTLPAAEASRLRAEADGLAALAQCTAFRIPRVLAQGIDGDTAWLATEWLDLSPLRERDAAIAFARALASLHRIQGDSFGWRCGNFIGATPQANHEHDNWTRFFISQRLQPQLERACALGHNSLREDGERLCEKLPALFVDHKPEPSLVHGDLWGGNAGCLPDGTPAIFDPAIYRGDREVDLAMSELFGGFPPAFYAAYREAWPLAAGYEQRKSAYNLYHVLNHLNLFGRSYIGQAERMLRSLLALLT